MQADQSGEAVLRAEAVHFIGIGGTGMQALAEVLLARGLSISGSDASPSAALDRLRDQGARIFLGQRAEHLEGAAAVVISAAIPAENEELQAAQRRGLPVATHAQVLGAMSRAMRTIAIAGTHGKSTTTALTAHLLVQCGMDPIVSGGAFAPNLGGSGRAGQGDCLIVEADEFARRFLQLTPTIAVITNLEADHLDHYGSFDAIAEAFTQFTERLRADGSLLVCLDGPMPESIRRHPALESYGARPDAAWRMLDYVATDAGSTFTLRDPSGTSHRVRSALRGQHNALNATAAIAASHRAGAPLESAIHAVEAFRGTHRRFQTVLKSEFVWIVDDYAHHPTELRATLRAAREAHPGRIRAVFQPHTRHRTRALFSEFAASFADASEVVLLPIYLPTGREPEDIDISSEALAAAMSHPSVRTLKSMDEAADHLVQDTREGDLILLLGAGDVTNLGPRLSQRLGARR